MGLNARECTLRCKFNGSHLQRMQMLIKTPVTRMLRHCQYSVISKIYSHVVLFIQTDIWSELHFLALVQKNPNVFLSWCCCNEEKNNYSIKVVTCVHMLLAHSQSFLPRMQILPPYLSAFRSFLSCVWDFLLLDASFGSMAQIYLSILHAFQIQFWLCDVLHQFTPSIRNWQFCDIAFIQQY